jgi:hypothetical protein
VKDQIVIAARAIDRGQPEETLAALRALALVDGHRPERLVAVALWRRLLPYLAAARGAPAEAVAAAFENLVSATHNRMHVWNAYEAIPVLEAQIGADDTAAIVAAAVWDGVLRTNPAMFNLVFNLFYRAGGTRCAPALTQFLAAQPDHAPVYWQFLLLVRSMPAGLAADPERLVADLLAASGRDDLAPLFAIYLMQMRQEPVAAIVAAAQALAAPAQRRLVADYMAGMSYTPDEIETVVAALPALLPDEIDHPLAELMRARRAIARGQWEDALAGAAACASEPQYRHSAGLLRAIALAHQQQPEQADAALDAILGAADAAPFQKARATFIRVANERLRRGLPLPENVATVALPEPVGRPLAQGLWVGPRLRWIERLSIQSYLANGWRFQLYAYDEVAGVPDGCEVLDAAAIIPRHEVFREGHGSGPHAGSLGAFSDLFRYRLLAERGGMWTDTDVINRRLFEPDGARFVSTELTDAGLVTLNGAIMAAPAGDPLVVRAYERSRELLASSDRMFFTRIGPLLLAELVLELGVDAVELMPPHFLSPISWMNTASLRQPYEIVSRRPDIRDAVNIHVYTEMWRTLGLGLDQPPSADSFLGRLYVEHFGAGTAGRASLDPAGAGA